MREKWEGRFEVASLVGGPTPTEKDSASKSAEVADSSFALQFGKLRIGSLVLIARAFPTFGIAGALQGVRCLDASLQRRQGTRFRRGKDRPPKADCKSQSCDLHPFSNIPIPAASL